MENNLTEKNVAFLDLSYQFSLQITLILSLMVFHAQNDNNGRRYETSLTRYLYCLIESDLMLIAW